MILHPFSFFFFFIREKGKRFDSKKTIGMETMPLSSLEKKNFSILSQRFGQGREQMGAWKVRVPTSGNKSSVVNKLTRCLSDLCSPTPPLRLPVNCYTRIRVYGRRKRVL